MKIHIIPTYSYSPLALSTYRKVGQTLQGTPVPEDTEVLITRLEPITADLIAPLPALKVIGSSTTGDNHIDLEAAKARGIQVVTLKGKLNKYDITSTAEHTIGLILACLRDYPRAFKDQYRFPRARMSGKTLGIIGYGRVGKMVGQYAVMMGMKVLFYDIKKPANDTRFRDLKKLVYLSDVLSIHCTLDKTTKGMIGDDLLGLMRHGSLLINTARPDIVDTVALLKKLDEGIITRAAVDMAPCDPATEAMLREYNKRNPSHLLLTPHLGGCTTEDMALTEEILAKEVCALISPL